MCRRVVVRRRSSGRRVTRETFFSASKNYHKKIIQTTENVFFQILHGNIDIVSPCTVQFVIYGVEVRYSVMLLYGHRQNKAKFVRCEEWRNIRQRG